MGHQTTAVPHQLVEQFVFDWGELDRPARYGHLMGLKVVGVPLIIRLKSELQSKYRGRLLKKH